MKPENFDNKLQHSIDLLRKSEALALRYYAAGFYLAFSGGKDSQALYHLAKLAGVKFDQFTREKEIEGVQCINGKDKIVINPIIDWSETDVWYFLNEVVKVEHCTLYDRGRRRLGCLFCPMASKKEIIKQGGGLSKVSRPNASHYRQVKRKRLHEPVRRPHRRGSI